MTDGIRLGGDDGDTITDLHDVATHLQLIECGNYNKKLSISARRRTKLKRLPLRRPTAPSIQPPRTQYSVMATGCVTLVVSRLTVTTATSVTDVRNRGVPPAAQGHQQRPLQQRLRVCTELRRLLKQHLHPRLSAALTQPKIPNNALHPLRAPKTPSRHLKAARPKNRESTRGSLLLARNWPSTSLWRWRSRRRWRLFSKLGQPSPKQKLKCLSSKGNWRHWWNSIRPQRRSWKPVVRNWPKPRQPPRRPHRWHYLHNIISPLSRLTPAPFGQHSKLLYYSAARAFHGTTGANSTPRPGRSRRRSLQCSANHHHHQHPRPHHIQRQRLRCRTQEQEDPVEPASAYIGAARAITSS